MEIWKCSEICYESTIFLSRGPNGYNFEDLKIILVWGIRFSRAHHAFIFLLCLLCVFALV